MRALALHLALLTAPLLVSAANLHAQDSRSAQDSLGAMRSGWLVGASIGVPAYEGEAVAELFTIGVHWTQLRVSRLGADFSLGTVPRVLREGVLALGARGGVALPLALSPHVLLLPSGGVSVLGGIGSGGGGGTAGFNAGIAAVLLGGNAVGLRTGVTWHRFGDADRGLWLWEVGLVRGPRQR